METVSDLRKKYCPPALGAAIMIAVAMIFTGHSELGRGLVLGTLFSILNFILMGESIQLRMQRTQRSSSVVSFFMVLVRFVLLAFPLIVSIHHDKYHIATTAAGLFMVQAVILTGALGKLVTSRQA